MTPQAALYKKTITSAAIKRVVLSVMCLAILVVIPVAGLRPFNPRPRNEVKWLTPENGLEFREDGSVFSEEPIKIPSSTEEQVSLDIWVRPAIVDTAPILSFDRSHGAEQFRLLQYGDSLVLQKKNGDAVAALDIEHSLNPGQSAFFTITADRQQTSVYINGVLAKTSSNFIATPGSLSGRLVAGSQPFDYDSWLGQLRWLAIYRRRLTASQALAHYQSRITGGVLAGAAGDLDDAVVLYRFDEHQGNLVHNAVATGPDLLIPKAFTILEKKFLEPPWPVTLNRSYFQNAAINIAGFIPLGFCLCAFLHTRKIRLGIPAPWATVIFGAALSLTIEVLQFYLPSRDSSLTDVLTNTLGTVIGMIFWQLTSRWLVPWLNPLDGTVQSPR